MNWNFDYDISALIITAVLIIYYTHRKILPLVRNYLFLVMMGGSMMVAATDILASVIDSYYVFFPVWFLYLINILYYLSLAGFPMAFAFYCSCLCGRVFWMRGEKINLLLILPGGILGAVLLTTPIHHIIFSISPEGEFAYGPGRSVFYVEAVVYLLWGAYIVTKEREKLFRIQRGAVYLMCFFLLLGHTLRVVSSPYTQVLSLSVTVGLLIMFLAYQNPDYDKDPKTGMLSQYSLRVLKNEEVVYSRHKATAYLAFENYKSVQATYGNDIASHIIQSVSLYLRMTFPKSKIFYVHNGRFVMELDGDAAATEQMYGEILRRCEEPFDFATGAVTLYPRFVYSLADIPYQNHNEFRECMRMAMRQAMKSKNGSYVVVTRDIYQAALKNLEVEAALKRALSDDGLEVFYQPIYNTREKRITCAEALVRIRDEKMGLLFPDEFIWRAENNGSILSLGEQVFRKVCRFIRDNDMEALGLEYIEVNLSPMQCVREELADELIHIMQEFAVSPNYINLEITESSSADDEVILGNIKHLSGQGITFSLDDYGTGYSNLVNVLSLPLNVVKIDKSIVWSYFRESSDLLPQVISTFKGNDFEIVCEGVETEEMAVTLAEMGCLFEQGYYYSKPVTEQEFLAYVRAA